VIIKIDGFHGQTLLSGKKRSKRKLREMYKESLSLITNVEELPKIFCILYNFEQIPYSSDIQIDFVIDTDTGRIYTPSY